MFCFSSPQSRVCDYCHEKVLKESIMPNQMIQSVVVSNNHGPTDDVDISFEVRPERLSATTDTQSTS